jgi:hypothetical protein
MSRKFCLFAQFFSKASEFDCERGHRHLSAKEVEQGIGKEFKYWDLHPVKQTARYIELFEHERPVDPDTVQGTQKTHISENVMRNASGAYLLKGGDSHWSDAGARESAARNKVAAYGADNREFSRIVAHDRLVELKNFAWDDGGLTAGFREDKSRGVDKLGKKVTLQESGWRPKGRPLRVGLKPRTADVLSAALGLWRFIEVRLTSTVTDRPADQSPAPKRGPFRPETPIGYKVHVRIPRKTFFAEHTAALKELDNAWPAILAGYYAGPHSEEMNSLPASQLPSQILTETLRAYLEIDSDRWQEIEGKNDDSRTD